MKSVLLPPGADLIDEISARLIGRNNNYSASLVIFPGKRPSHFLRKSLAGRLRSGFMPPAIFSMDEFIDHVYKKNHSARKLDAIDAVPILYEIQTAGREMMGGEGFLSFDSFFPVGMKIYRDIEEMMIEGIEHHRIKEVEMLAGETIPEQTLKRLRSMAHFYKEFYRKVEELGYSTRSLRYRKIAGVTGEELFKEFEQVMFAGFFGFTNTEKILFKKLRDIEKVFLIFQDGPGLKENISDLGITFDMQQSAQPEPEMRFYTSPDSHGQVFALCSALEKIQEREAIDERTAIVMPSSDILFPLLRQALPMLGEPGYNISLGYPLLRTPIFGFISNLMELVLSMDGDRIYIPDYLKFVLHPYTKNIYFNKSAEVTRIIFHTIEEALTRSTTRTLLTLKEIEESDSILSLIIKRLGGEQGISKEKATEHIRGIHDSTIRSFLSFENVKDFAAKCTGMLAYIFNNSTARVHPLFYPFFEAFMRALDEVSKSLMKDMSFAAASGYFAFFRKYIALCRVPFEGVPIRGLQALGFLETRNLKFDRVFILDANEGTLPATQKEDSLLPFKAREGLGLPTYLDRDRLAAYYFSSLLSGAKEAHIFFVEDDKKERSRFVEKLIWERQKKDRTTDNKRYLRTVQYQVHLGNASPPEIKKTEAVAAFLKHYEFSATALDRYLKCGLRFYYGHVLRIDREEKVSGDVEKTDIGRFVHAALSAFFSEKTGKVLKEADIDVNEMGLVIDRLFKESYGENPVGAAYLLKKQIKEHLSDLLRKYYLPMLKEGVAILNTEEDINSTIEGFNLKGRIDCVMKRGPKKVIMDYKTSSSENYLKINMDKLNVEKRDTWEGAIGSLQLPFYLMLYSQKYRIDIKDLDANFLLLGKSVIGSGIELPLFNGPDLSASFDLLKSVMLKLIREIVDPEMRFKPAQDRKKRCPGCDFRHICGTQWITG